MVNILILYYSKHGNTQKMARLMARGVASVPGCEAHIRTVPPLVDDPDFEPSKDALVTEQDLANCDGMILGSPSYFGNMASPLKAFIDSTGELWFTGQMAGKPASVFCTASSLHGGQETTLMNMMIPLFHHGMLVMGLPYTEKSLLYTKTGGSPYGATHWAELDSNRAIDADEKQLCLAQGKRMAEVAKRLKTAG